MIITACQPKPILRERIDGNSQYQNTSKTGQYVRKNVPGSCSYFHPFLYSIPQPASLFPAYSTGAKNSYGCELPSHFRMFFLLSRAGLFGLKMYKHRKISIMDEIGVCKDCSINPCRKLDPSIRGQRKSVRSETSVATMAPEAAPVVQSVLNRPAGASIES